jgi:hypothetical protein
MGAAEMRSLRAVAGHTITVINKMKSYKYNNKRAKEIARTL